MVVTIGTPTLVHPVSFPALSTVCGHEDEVRVETTGSIVLILSEKEVDELLVMKVTYRVSVGVGVHDIRR
ncbi:hypothetical protein PHLCEN_2v6735 [Hermanssonia centrifuga]|uniref:Uncharacterized protein n=1 Tax=Hermanssonia centrifuga TaxID=98765 RepID=A0A2R6NYJ8_9APHY|nr:hypothetical protein PHLCEN_2v6735 [Hermanssonia centrifuga]